MGKNQKLNNKARSKFSLTGTNVSLEGIGALG